MWKANRMRIGQLLIAALLASSCSAEVPGTPEKLMDQIEKTVTLPETAYPMEAYGRNYAFTGRGEVRAVYLVPSALEGLVEAASVAAAGERRFFSSTRELPKIADGGCRVVTVVYDVPTRRMIMAACSPR